MRYMSTKLANIFDQYCKKFNIPKHERNKALQQFDLMYPHLSDNELADIILVDYIDRK